MTHSAKRIIGIGIATLLGVVGACWDDGPTRPDLRSPTIVLSDTSVLATSAALAGDMAASVASGSEPEVAYVSLPPGSIQDGVSALITNRRTRSSTTTRMVDGGFDPVTIGARAGDTLETTVSRSNAESVSLLGVVPRRLRPTIVRTIPPRGKKDVPLNARITVVFSEPIDPASLTSGAMILRRGSTAVSGRIQIGDPQGLSVDFVPDAWLGDATSYELVVSENIRDWDGEALGARATVEFITQELSAAIGPIAFQLMRRSPADVQGDTVGSYIHVLEDSRVTRLTHGRTWDGCPKWSPDGLKIAFSRSDPNGPIGRVHVMNRDGSGLKTLLPIDAGCPAWSPDGTMLAFAGPREGAGPTFMAQGIYVMNADGSNLRKVTDQGASGNPPTWSPDGGQLAFVTVQCTARCDPDNEETLPDREFDIAIVNVDGTGLRKLSQSGEDSWPVWSPDGATIAFHKSVPSTYESNTSSGGIYTMKADGSDVRKVSSGTRDVSDLCPSWSPDGKMIAFSSNRDGNHLDVYVMNADGSGIRRLTNTAEEKLCPSWSPARGP